MSGVRLELATAPATAEAITQSLGYTDRPSRVPQTQGPQKGTRSLTDPRPRPRQVRTTNIVGCRPVLLRTTPAHAPRDSRAGLLVAAEQAGE